MSASSLRNRSVAADALRVGGMTPLTSIDFPGRLAAVLYCQGCPWRCGYCHNPELLDATAPAAIAWPQVQDFLTRRRGLIDGVVFSGGEPTLQRALPAALEEVRALGFETALHTGGMYPDRLATALPLLDWVGLDIKASRSHYDAITGVPGSGIRARESLAAVQHSAVSYECRTTWHPDLFPVAGLLDLADELAELGVCNWVVQAWRLPHSPAAPVSSALLAALSARFPGVTFRPA